MATLLHFEKCSRGSNGLPLVAALAFPRFHQMPASIARSVLATATHRLEVDVVHVCGEPKLNGALVDGEFAQVHSPPESVLAPTQSSIGPLAPAMQAHEMHTIIRGVGVYIHIYIHTYMHPNRLSE